MFREVKLLQRLRGSNSHGNGHTDHGERPDRRQWRGKGGERVAAVGEGRRRIAEDIRRAPQQEARSDSNLQPACRLLPYNPNGRRKKVTSAKAEVTIVREVKLLQRFLNSNSHGNGHTDHRVVTCAQEAHHLNDQAAFGRLLCCSATGFAYLIPMREACHQGMVTRSFYKKVEILSRPKEKYIEQV